MKKMRYEMPSEISGSSKEKIRGNFHGGSKDKGPFWL